MTKQQTGFRADKELLNKFRSRLAREGRNMGPVIEGFITAYLDASVLANQQVYVDRSGAKNFPESTEWDIIHEVLDIVRTGGEPADTLRRTVVTLAREAKREREAWHDMKVGGIARETSIDDE